MIKKYIQIAAIVSFFLISISPLNAKDSSNPGEIKRLTYSDNNVVHYPCLSDDGRWMLYTIEIKNEEETIKAVRIMNVGDGKERELFRDGEKKAPAPFEDISLLVGSKPPVLSGNGRVAVFSISLGTPANILDHYLAVVNADGTNFRIIPFSIKALEGKNLKPLEFTGGDWERVSNYAVSSDGKRIACVLKGHLGPRRYGNPGGIVLLDASTQKQRTILAPDFDGNGWEWPSFPCRPLIGGGWAFALSGNGQKIVFGAQSSADKIDYDLYVVNWVGEEIRKITDFHDRWFSLADISHDGEKIVFFYNGRKKQGIGTYSVNGEGKGLKYIKSGLAPRVELFDMSGDGQYILFKHIYKGMILNLNTGLEMVAFGESTPGYAKGLTPMDFPRIPAFWSPKIISLKGDRVLLVGPPQGKETPEIYMLSIDVK
jgi:Tol biopolymer transport system component